jgi:hypothetical protein
MTKIEVFEELEQLECDPEHMPQVKELLPRMLFLDDRTKRIESALRQYAGKYDLTIVTNAKECLRYLCKQPWDVLSLDHDLGGIDFQDPDDVTSGMEVVRYIAKTACVQALPWDIPEIWIHSSNLFAGNKMIDVLQQVGIRSHYRRFEYDIDTEKKFFDGEKTETVVVHSKEWQGHRVTKCSSCKFEKLVNKDCQCKSCYQREVIQCS